MNGVLERTLGVLELLAQHGEGMELAAIADTLDIPRSAVHRLLADLVRLGLIRPGERPPAVPLTGGVSSDIWKVDLPSGPVAVKRALANIIEPALKEQWGAVDATKLKRHFATVRELVEAWRGLGLACGEQHRRAAANALFNLLRRAGHERPEAASASICCCTSSVMR